MSSGIKRMAPAIHKSVANFDIDIGVAIATARLSASVGICHLVGNWNVPSLPGV